MRFYLQEFEDDQFGYYLVADPADTLGDYVDEITRFMDEMMTECRGCDGCCFERIPLTIADFYIAKPLIARLTGKALEDVTITDWLQEVAEIHVEPCGSIDIVLKRNEDDSCRFLNTDKQECSEHLWRPLVCRTHYCLSKALSAIDMRGDIINAGEDELCRQLLTTPNHPWQELLAECRLEDYAENGFSHVNRENWRDIPLESIVSAENWQKVLAESPDLEFYCG